MFLFRKAKRTYRNSFNSKVDCGWKFEENMDYVIGKVWYVEKLFVCSA